MNNLEKSKNTKPKRKSIVGGAYNNLSKRKGYRKGRSIHLQGSAVNPAVTFDYVASTFSNNPYIISKEYNLAKVYDAHKNEVEDYFKTSINELQNSGEFIKLFNKYQDKENKILNAYKQAYGREESLDEVLNSLSNTLNISGIEINNKILEMKRYAATAFNNERFFAFNDKWMKKRTEEWLNGVDDFGTQKQKNDWKHAAKLLEEIVNQIKSDLDNIGSQITLTEKILSLGVGEDNYSSSYLKAISNILKATEGLNFNNIESEDFIKKFHKSGIYKDLGFYFEGAAIVGMIEGLRSILIQNFEPTVDIYNVYTGQSKTTGKTLTIDEIREQCVPAVSKIFQDQVDKKVLITSQSSKDLITADVNIPIKTLDGTENLRIDIKSYKDKYKATREIKDSQSDKIETVNLKDILEIGPQNTVGYLLFLNILASKLGSSYLSDNGKLQDLIFLWIMIKNKGFETLFGTDTQFILLGDKIIRFSTLLKSLMNENIVIGTKTSKKTTIDYGSYTKKDTLKIKNQLKKEYRWSAHSTNSYDLLYKNNEFFKMNSETVESLKKEVIFKQKIKINFKNLS